MTGTDCDLFTHNSSRSYLNHLVHAKKYFVHCVFKLLNLWSCQINTQYVYSTAFYIHMYGSFSLSLSLSLRRNSPTRARAASFSQFLDHTQWHTTVSKTPLDEGSARAETSTWQQTTFTRDRHSCRRRDSNTQPQQASGFVSYRSATGLGTAWYQPTCTHAHYNQVHPLCSWTGYWPSVSGNCSRNACKWKQTHKICIWGGFTFKSRIAQWLSSPRFLIVLLRTIRHDSFLPHNFPRTRHYRFSIHFSSFSYWLV